jgi:tetratricopeptide (TPR) repeat protein
LERLNGRAREARILLEPFRDEADAGAITLRAAALAELAVAHTFLGEHHLAAPLFEEAMTTLELQEAWPALAQALVSRAVFLVYQHRGQEAIGVIRQGLALAELHDLPGVALRARYNLAGALLDADRFADALAELEIGLALARERGDRQWEGLLRAQATTPLTLLGRWDQALSTAGSLLADQAGNPVFAAEFVAIIAEARGDRELLGRCAEVARRNRDATHLDMRGSGRATAARMIMEDSPAQALALGRPVLDTSPLALETVGNLYTVCVEASVALADDAAMADLAAWQEALPPARTGVIMRAGRARLRAELAHRAGDSAEAERLEREALGHLRPADVRALMFSAYLDQVRRRRDPAAQAQAREIAVELGATQWLERLQREGRAAQLAGG